MKFGLGFFSLQRPPYQDREFADLYEDFFKQCELADGLGLDSIWTCEHHFCDDGYLNSITPITAAALARTKRIAIGADISYSLHNPIRFAEDAIALDIISRGRFIVGLGATYINAELEPFGMTTEGEAERLSEYVEIMRLAMTNKPFSYNGKHYQIPEIRVTPDVYSSGGPKIVLGSRGDPETEMLRAAKSGDHYRTNPAWPLDDVVRLARGFSDRRKDDKNAEIFVYNYGFISESTDPWEVMEPGYRYVRQTYDRMAGRSLPQHATPASKSVVASRATDRLNRDDFRLILGDRKQVKTQIQQCADLIGDQMHFIFRLSYPGVDPERTSDAIQLYADVAKEFQN